MSLYAYPYEMSAHLIVRGEDAADFLQSQFSNDLRPFSVGQCTYGLWLDVKGKIVADSWILCEGEERFRVFSECCEGPLIQDKLEHHIIADDVELELGPQAIGLALVGEDVGDLEASLQDGLACFTGRRSKMPSRELVFSDGPSRDAWMNAHACEIVSKGWIQQERIKAGVSIVQAEVLPGDLPAEGGLVEDAVSLSKGCFLGQEVVARMHNIGRPQRSLFRLSGSGALPDVPAAITNEAGKSLGDVRAALTTATGWEGVAMLKSRFVDAGMQVLLADRPVKVENAYSKNV